jgi:hypothetical protein
LQVSAASSFDDSKDLVLINRTSCIISPTVTFAAPSHIPEHDPMYRE